MNSNSCIQCVRPCVNCFICKKELPHCTYHDKFKCYFEFPHIKKSLVLHIQSILDIPVDIIRLICSFHIPVHVHTECLSLTAKKFANDNKHLNRLKNRAHYNRNKHDTLFLERIINQEDRQWHKDINSLCTRIPYNSIDGDLCMNCSDTSLKCQCKMNCPFILGYCKSHIAFHDTYNMYRKVI